MIDALLNLVTKNNPHAQINIVTGSNEASKEAQKKGLIPLEIWKHAFSPSRILQELKALSPDALVVVGADVMDGYYNSYLPLHAIMFADIASRLGARSVILGFSFNKTPSLLLKQVFELANPAVKINLRDSVSLDRFEAFCDHKTQLVADAAFYLEPKLKSKLADEVKEWVEKAHAENALAIVFNIHPMLFKKGSSKQVQNLIDAAARAIEAVSSSRSVRWFFLPHDFRKDVGDNDCLLPLAAELTKRGVGDNILTVEKNYTASELKAAVGQVDGVITARMHLAIGSLGMGRPVAAITYQDKFQGLFRHFNLPNWLLLSPQEILESDALEKMILRFLDENVEIKQCVENNLPSIMALSYKNFEFILAAAAQGES
ncbi:polysaccharide pyruvyl transferase family protein [Desulfovibrio sp. UCD-KL4C]|uniref:polysaccharide pyruvyl transferase family protein n=1 Tax=Desulfovibrio sp. UCD-KL4C TaxID=2578120 RepID=UPI0025C1CF86|nr:polysaccharide pyruvyl transferase family protein [Desulfovibrio sp. UCD-KL4C]